MVTVRLLLVLATAGALRPVARRAVLLGGAPAAALATAVASPRVAGAFGGGSALEQGKGLPDGAAQFDRFRKVQSEWDRFGARLQSTDLDAAEWDGVPSFLRRLYDAGDDMVFLSKPLSAADQATAKDLARDFREAVKGADRPAQNKDRATVLAAYEKTSKMLARFLDLSSDVPDEL